MKNKTLAFKPIIIKIKDAHTYAIFKRVMEQEERRLSLELAKLTFKLHALRTKDISDLPPSIIKEWEEKGFIKNGKLIDEEDEPKLLAENNN